MKTARKFRQLGVSLLESLIVLAVTAVTLGTAAPSLLRAQDKHRLEGATAQLETELQYARSEAIAMNQPVRFSFRADTAESCYVIHTGAAHACVCQGANTVCTAGARALRTATFDAASRLRITSNSASFLFDADKGTVTPTATLEVRHAGGHALRLVVNIMGRVRACTPTAVAGFAPC